MFEKKFLLGVGFTIATEKEVLEYIITGLEKKAEKYYIVTPNPEILVIANKNKNYKTVLNEAKLALPDGVGVTIASKLLGKGLKRRITGVDLVEMLCMEGAKKPITIGFLGSRPGVADKTAECLQKKYPGLKVIFAKEEWNEGSSKQIDILFVAFGSPKQELWIAENLSKLPVKVVIGVGGSFDFISGRVKRAPAWIRKAGFEWLYRLINEPWRIKRQLSLITFIFLVFQQFFKGEK